MYLFFRDCMYRCFAWNTLLLEDGLCNNLIYSNHKVCSSFCCSVSGSFWVHNCKCDNYLDLITILITIISLFWTLNTTRRTIINQSKCKYLFFHLQIQSNLALVNCLQIVNNLALVNILCFPKSHFQHKSLLDSKQPGDSKLFYTSQKFANTRFD